MTTEDNNETRGSSKTTAAVGKAEAAYVEAMKEPRATFAKDRDAAKARFEKEAPVFDHEEADADDPMRAAFDEALAQYEQALKDARARISAADMAARADHDAAVAAAWDAA